MRVKVLILFYADQLKCSCPFLQANAFVSRPTCRYLCTGYEIQDTILWRCHARFLFLRTHQVWCNRDFWMKISGDRLFGSSAGKLDWLTLCLRLGDHFFSIQPLFQYTRYLELDYICAEMWCLISCKVLHEPREIAAWVRDCE